MAGGAAYRAAIAAALAGILALCLIGCGGGASTSAGDDGPVILATTPVLGAIARDAAGDSVEVRVIMPNGSDPHEWRPSARDVAALESADLIIENGLGLEHGLGDAIDLARESGVPVFTATDHVAVRKDGAGDPHFWTDPTQVRAVVAALPAAVRAATGTDITASAARAGDDLLALDASIERDVQTIPPAARVLVTGHESLGYLAARYGLRVVGAVTPSLSSQGQVSAAHLAELEEAMREAGVTVVFVEAGVPGAVADAIAGQTRATPVEIAVETVPSDGRYHTYMTALARRVTSALAGSGG